jgi:SAM-dependent methyltransferase/uncharacterized protein YbaR (Trm112 family)
MKVELLDVLCEPGTGAGLELVITEVCGTEVWTGNLHSLLTGKDYPIVHGVPRFVGDEDYTASFGLQWSRFSRVQLDSANGACYSRERFQQEVGWSEEELRGRWLLDCGCGSGRFAEVAAELGARVIALDYSVAVDATARNLARFPNVFCIQGDLLCPPIKPGTMDYAYSLGVLQHTPDPQAAMAKILSLLAPGGQFAFTVYARRWYTRFYSKYLLRPLTRRMPPERLLRVVEATMPVLFPATDFLFRLPMVGRVAQFMIPVANYVHKTEFSIEQRYQEAILDTFDMLSPAFDSPMTVDEVKSALIELGMHNYVFRSTRPINVGGTVNLAASGAHGWLKLPESGLGKRDVGRQGT